MEYLYCIILEWLIQLIEILGAVSTIVLAIYAVKAYYKFLNNKFSESQLEAVIGLIKTIQSCDNYYHICSDRGGGMNIDLTYIIEFRLFDFSCKIDDQYNETPILFQRNTQSEITADWRFYYHYIHNPLVPKSIIDELKKFEVSRISCGSDEAIVFSSTEQYKSLKSPLFPISLNHNPMTVAQFKYAIDQLSNAISSWLDNHGINGELNL